MLTYIVLSLGIFKTLDRTARKIFQSKCQCIMHILGKLGIKFFKVLFIRIILYYEIKTRNKVKMKITMTWMFCVTSDVDNRNR